MVCGSPRCNFGRLGKDWSQYMLKRFIGICDGRSVTALAAIIGSTLLTPSASAQRASFGMVLGGYTNQDFYSDYIPTPGFHPEIFRSNPGGYLVGPSLAVRLSSRLSLGVDALYKPLHYKSAATFTSSGHEVIGWAPNTVVTWQFPILARYEFSESRIKPFVEAGPSFRTAGNLNNADPSHSGISAGVGVGTQWRRLRVAPTVRYTRWGKDPWSANARTRPDQVEFLVALRFGRNEN